MKDARGIERGACSRCGCAQYQPPGEAEGTRSIKCVACCHAPGLHQNLSTSSLLPGPPAPPNASVCCILGCQRSVDFDPNSGAETLHCRDHASTAQHSSGSIAYDGSVVDMQTTQQYAQVVPSDCTALVPYQPPQFVGSGAPQTSALDIQTSMFPDAQTTMFSNPQFPFLDPQTHFIDPQTHFLSPHTFISTQNTHPIQNTVPYSHTGVPQTLQAIVPLQNTVPPTPIGVPISTHSSGQKCALPECPNMCYIDENGRVHDCCGRSHDREYKQRQLIQGNQAGLFPPQPPPPPPLPPSFLPPPPPPLPPPLLPPSVPPLSSHLPSGQKKCAIPECPNPCYTDASGHTHDCCGITHAMEHQRRTAIQQQQQVVKGVTHCLLPECNKLVWPFENYCGKTHARIGTGRGLAPPVPPTNQNSSVSKDNSMCIIPGCTKQKYTETGGVTHPYCGKGHADLAQKMGIKPTADKPEDECDLPGCKQPKRREGDHTHNYCSKAHADQDAPNRAAQILKTPAEVDTFLKQFSAKFKVTKMVENPAAQQGGELFKRFKQAWDSLPPQQRTTQLAFHGTRDSNISSICQNGYNKSLRSGQRYGAGEYFAKTPDIPISYCKGGKRILLNELLLGVQGKHHTQHGQIIVMKFPEHDLPRFVLTFQ